jgi:PHD/YefM family antitoxin component YafN of YafNO toxin-antitoxin module
MKKLLTISLSAGLAIALSGCAGSSAPSVSMMDAVKADEKKVCSVEANGIEKVIATAEAYNAIAIKEGVEYRRLGINNSSAIAAVKEGIKSGAKTVTPADVKGKKKQKFDINYAAERACKFGIGALVQKHEAATQYRDAIPGDGYKY